jgi:hypothetical protein
MHLPFHAEYDEGLCAAARAMPIDEACRPPLVERRVCPCR